MNVQDLVLVDLDRLANIVSSRKMLLSDLKLPETALSSSEPTVAIARSELERVASLLSVDTEYLAYGYSVSKIENGVDILKRAQGYVRTAERSGVPYYTYHHLAKSAVVPTLMPLRIEILCDDESKVTMNTHACPEFVLVEQGTVMLLWEEEAVRNCVELAEGDSAVIRPNTPHSFLRITSKAQILAINF